MSVCNKAIALKLPLLLLLLRSLYDENLVQRAERQTVFSVASNSYPGILAAPQTVTVDAVVHTQEFCCDAGTVNLRCFSCFRLVMPNGDFVAISNAFLFE